MGRMSGVDINILKAKAFMNLLLLCRSRNEFIGAPLALQTIEVQEYTWNI